MEVDYTLVATPSEDSQNSLDVTSAINGDVKAYGRIYTLYVERIYRYVYYLVRDKMTAEDLTEEVFIKAWKSIGNCKGRERTFSSWLYRIAHNHSIEMMRKNRREISFENVNIADDSDPEKAAEDSLELQDVFEAVKSLPEQQKQVILLKFLDDAGNEEIGRILGKRQGTVRALQMRALINLRKKFDGGADSYGR
jgi:RNA polymerase sigma-70 factor, ECF subfamily